MPIDDPALQGTEKDGSKSQEYCTYCYQQGAYINPKMTLNEMTSVVKLQMENRKIDQQIIDMAVNSLPGLKRWTAAKTTV
jgi:radical SAM superfamily enzyme